MKHGPWCKPPHGWHWSPERIDARSRRWRRLQCFIKAKLHRRIFLWFGASIMLTGAVVGLAFGLSEGREGTPWHQELDRSGRFLAQRFARVWDDPVARDELAASAAATLELILVLEDTDNRPLAPPFGATASWQPVHRHHPPHLCPDCGVLLRIDAGGHPVGYVRIITDRHPHKPWQFFLGLIIAVITLWAASGAIARRIVRPLIELERVTRRIGEGDFSARVDLGRHHAGEVGVVAEAVNEMAARIEKQLAEQRELLAAVSHEMRTPLGHMRILVELARDGGADGATMDDLERELLEMDALIDELLASSRLDFAALTTTDLDAGEVARRAAQRAGLAEELVQLELTDRSFAGDPTLLSRALANLLDNAQKHGGGVTAFRVRAAGAAIRFEVEDDGPGLSESERERIFQSFYQGRTNGNGAGTTKSSLGLGLSLVRRIASVHGGKAGAENVTSAGGARVWIELARHPGASSADH